MPFPLGLLPLPSSPSLTLSVRALLYLPARHISHLLCFFFGVGQKLWKFINHINLKRNVRRPGRGSLVHPLSPPPRLAGAVANVSHVGIVPVAEYA